MNTRARLTRHAQLNGWAVEDGRTGQRFVKGALVIVVRYSARGAITGGHYGTAGRLITGRGKYEQVVQLLARWTE